VLGAWLGGAGRLGRGRPVQHPRTGPVRGRGRLVALVRQPARCDRRGGGARLRRGGLRQLRFDPNSDESVLVVPQVVVGSRDGVGWITEIDAGPGTANRLPPVRRVSPIRRATGVRYSEGLLSVERWRRAVAEAVRRMRRGDLFKAVFAHDLLATADEPPGSPVPAHRPRRALPHLLELLGGRPGRRHPGAAAAAHRHPGQLARAGRHELARCAARRRARPGPAGLRQGPRGAPVREGVAGRPAAAAVCHRAGPRRALGAAAAQRDPPFQRHHRHPGPRRPALASCAWPVRCTRPPPSAVPPPSPRCG